MYNVDIITIQSNNVLDCLDSGEYHASLYRVRNKPNLIEPYKELMKHYGYSNVPVFCCREDRYCPMNVSDVGNILLELSVPSNFINYQSFYDWTDFIYFTEFPRELLDNSPVSITYKESFVTSMFNESADDKYIEEQLQNIKKSAFREYEDIKYELQVTIPCIKREWVKSYIPLSHLTDLEFSELTVSGYSFSEIKHKDIYTAHRVMYKSN